MNEIDEDAFAKFRTNLTLLRISKGWSAADVSEWIGGKPKRVTDLEYGLKGRGVPKSAELIKLAAVFGVSLEDLVNKEAKIIFE